MPDASSAPTKPRRGPTAKPASKTVLVAARVSPELAARLTAARGPGVSEADALRYAIGLYIDEAQAREIQSRII